jgi:hypothetical protein
MHAHHHGQTVAASLAGGLVLVLALGAVLVLRGTSAHAEHPAVSAPAESAPADARAFVAALRAGDRAGALRHGSPAVYDELVRDERDSTARARLQRCTKSPGGGSWTCGLDFPSTGPADGEAFTLTLTRRDSRWQATAAAIAAG